MFDPTIFENLKVAFENHIYDLDNIDRKITIVNRADRMDFAILARELSIQFSLVDQPDATAEVVMEASLKDLAEEILEIPEAKPGCSLLLRLNKRVHNVSTQCEQIEQALYEVWENDIQLTQTLSFVNKQEVSGFMNNIEIEFKSKLNEDNMWEITPFLNHVLKTLEVLNRI
ncbi:hypothetical protein [Lederbergia citrea]|uniref:Uncharacterized protein n=1 Tax=Lederbergia citrea TaxID=2833581 RepID=A0A942UTL5_9BACI|nr:hypothetical protein [Lederbergia citrea]MBS4224831.1 hypothetical protein [Lederbergia citrea]